RHAGRQIAKNNVRCSETCSYIYIEIKNDLIGAGAFNKTAVQRGEQGERRRGRSFDRINHLSRDLAEVIVNDCHGGGKRAGLRKNMICTKDLVRGQDQRLRSAVAKIYGALQ